jgi:two-component system nitrate/nitrite response regulator NarL
MSPVDRILLAAIGEEQMLLDGLRAWLRSTPDLDLVAVAATVDDLLAGPGRGASVALLAPRRWAGSDPADNVRRLVGAGFRVLVVSDLTGRDQAMVALEAGAHGYITRDHGLTSLSRAVRQVAAGDIAFSPEIAVSLVNGRRPARPKLSRQERAILVAYVSGMTLDSAARKVGVKYGTAKEYLDRVKEKYLVAGRPARTKFELAQRAREDGITP